MTGEPQASLTKPGSSDGCEVFCISGIFISFFAMVFFGAMFSSAVLQTAGLDVGPMLCMERSSGLWVGTLYQAGCNGDGYNTVRESVDEGYKALI